MRNGALNAAILLTMMLAACGSADRPEVVEQIVVREPGAAALVQASASAQGAALDLVSLGEDAFQTCTGCHSIDAGAPSAAGPSLYGVVGRQAGALDGYPYSAALAASQVTWDAGSLDSYLADPGGFVPGTDMVAGTVTDADTRKAIIAYLSSAGK